MISMLFAQMTDEERKQREDEHEQRMNDPIRISFNILNQYARDQADQYEQRHAAENNHDTSENANKKYRI